MSTTTQSAAVDATTADQKVDVSEVIETDSLVEEVSIDGMCGVY